MLWAVQFEWPRGLQFTFNCYCHWVNMVVCNEDGSGYFLRSKECMTQGYPLAMIAYGIGISSIICNLHTAHPHVTQPWYSEDAGAVVMFEASCDHMHSLLVRGPPQGYFPDPTKSILVVSLRNFQRAEDHLRGIDMWLVTGRSYLGIFIGDQESEKAWLSDKV